MFPLRTLFVPRPHVPSLARIIRLVPAAAALQDENFVVGLRQTASGDRAAEAAPNHDRIKVHGQLLCSPLSRRGAEDKQDQKSKPEGTEAAEGTRNYAPVFLT